ncbi:YIP1 family protein [Clostridium folliculivorans]|uniref:Metal-binding protein n=1 Tax=Clostridium folliculivorans TaxID=2886038 RepID=A0A9W5XY46_9CLOT|nr:YIP1 family protein [Clostridium folliculivorans]GKU23229.1 metal-binding protein [Clostridium folliculivorans]GKU29346.1 metal-binding protein [Clostridium folliculivorans]
MFCKNCGNQIIEGDKFCGACGQPVDNPSGNSIRIKSEIGGEIVNSIKTYFTKPLSFFSEFKEKDVLRPSIVLLVVLPIIYGVFNILYTSAVINSIVNMIGKLPQLLSKTGMLSKAEATLAQASLMQSSEVTASKSMLHSLISNKDIFIKGVIQLLLIIILTGVVLLILNAVVLKNKIKKEDVLFIVTASYIPMVLSVAAASLVTLISISFGLFILASGYILSFITLYSGIRQLSEETNDKTFMLMIFLFLIISALLSICVTKYIEASFVQIKGIMDPIKDFL